MEFALTLITLIVGDVFWWAQTDRRLRGLPLGWAWRLVNGALMFVATLYASWILLAPHFFHRSQGAPPGQVNNALVLHATGYLWHVFVLPTAVLLYGAAWGVRKVVKWVRTPEARPAYLTAFKIGPLRAATVREWSAHTGALFGIFKALPPGSDRSLTVAARGWLSRYRRSAANLPGKTPSPTRREVIGAIAMAALPPLSAAALSRLAVVQAGEFQVRSLELPLAALPPDLDGVTIAHVSDLHLGKFTKPGSVERLIEAVNALRADLVVFTGDLIDYSVSDLPAGIDFMRGITSRHGPGHLAMIEGNHDLLHSVDQFEKTVRDEGLPLLLDEEKTFHVPGRVTPVQILGLCWGGPMPSDRTTLRYTDDGHPRRVYTYKSCQQSVEKVLPLRRADAFPIMLSHHPHAFDFLADAGLPLTLAGHTHGGQLMLTDHLGAGPMRFRYWTGEYRKANSHLFVSNGVGNWFPLRVNAPAELNLLKLRRAL